MQLLNARGQGAQDDANPDRASPDRVSFAQRCEELARENVSLQVKVARLQKENHYLRRITQMKPHVRLVVRAEAAAQLLALWHCAGLRTGRKASFAAGMSQDTFYAGRALLVLAAVHDGKRWVTTDPEVIEGRLKGAVELARKDVAHLVRNMPRSKRPKRG